MTRAFAHATLVILLVVNEQVRRVPRKFAKGSLRRVPGKMNKLESAYHEVLTTRLHAGEIVWFKYEAMTFKIGPDCRYTPDFSVQLPDGTMELHETKGHMMDDALVKIKTLVAQFPFRLLLVKRDAKKNGGNWNYKWFGELDDQKPREVDDNGDWI